VIVTTTRLAPGAVDGAPDPDEALSLRLRDLALVDLDALTIGAAAPQELIAAFADDVTDALREARARISALRAALGGADPLNVLDLPARTRASDSGAAGAQRVREKLGTHADVARTLARLSELAASLTPKLFEADRRR
jgi:hypothetical protein